MEPLFIEEIETNKTQISFFDEYVLKAFGGNKPVLRRSTRYKPISHFKCKRCDETFLTNAKLKTHKLSVHTVSFNSTNQSGLMEVVMHSTRDNSLCEVMGENLTIEDISNLEVKDELKNKMIYPFC